MFWFFLLTLQRNHYNEERQSNNGRDPYLRVHQVPNKRSLDDPYPEVVPEHDGRVKTVHVLGDERHYLPCGDLPEGRGRQLEGLPVEEGTEGRANFESQLGDQQHVGVRVDEVAEVGAYGDGCVEHCVGLGELGLAR